jgi:hypothetical protein
MRSIIIISVLFLYSFNQSFASDSTFKKYPWQLSVMLGFNSSTVAGSMVDFTNNSNHIDGLSDAKQTNKGGYLANISLQKNISEYIYLKSGLGFVHKQVYPENNTYILYRDTLSTNYLSVPLIIGSSFPVDKKQAIRIFVETGISGDIKISDNSPKAPDRMSFSTLPFLVNFQISGGVNYSLSNKVSVILQYEYILGLSGAYKEQLYYGAPDLPIFTGYYKYVTHSLSFGIKWKL